MKSAIRSALTIAIAAALGMPSAHAQNAGDRTKVLQAAAYALGMARWSDIVNTMEFQGSGTADRSGQPVKVEYHAALGYNPPAMRVEMTLTAAASGAPQHVIQTVREGYAWNESE